MATFIRAVLFTFLLIWMFKVITAPVSLSTTRVSTSTANASTSTAHASNITAPVSTSTARASTSTTGTSNRTERSSTSSARASTSTAQASNITAPVSTSTARASTSTAGASTSTANASTSTANASTSTAQASTITAPVSTSTERTSTSTAQASTSTALASTSTARTSTSTARASTTTARATSSVPTPTECASQDNTKENSQHNKDAARSDTAVFVGMIAGLVLLNVILLAVVIDSVRRRKCNGKEALSSQSPRSNPNTEAIDINGYDSVYMVPVNYDEIGGAYQQVGGNYHMYEDIESDNQDREKIIRAVAQITGNGSSDDERRDKDETGEVEQAASRNVYEQLSNYQDDDPNVHTYQQLHS
ncbi:uncharacterized protein LOC132720668 isoform X2 [Ruditapes philippinarum]|uniref:uncharacterized protein LOC132720668 isoform X2 n=1 Tax=Ruditapes philippinarum TaxID=129788 RepID=UPI00295B8E2A|nr:uncharacterized protein LOC132720668 isoform X2 [Ruditapes philippinarum]